MLGYVSNLFAEKFKGIWNLVARFFLFSPKALLYVGGVSGFAKT